MGDYWNDDTYGDDNGFNNLGGDTGGGLGADLGGAPAPAALGPGDKLNANGKVMKLAKVKEIAMRTVKAVDGGATFGQDSDGHSHVKVDFMQFNMTEERPKFKG